MIRILFRIGAALVALVALAIVAGWLALRGSLPQYDGRIAAPALTAPVVLERDRLGTVTIRAHDRHDVTWTLGYVEAQERFFEMDLLRRRAAGELSELFGPLALQADRVARAHRMRERAAAQLSSLSAADLDELRTYRDGINAGLAALDVRPFPYLLLRTKPEPWRTEDTALVVAAMAFTLNDAENARELAFSRMRTVLGDTVFRFLTATGGRWDAPLAGPPMDWPKTPPADAIDLRTLDPKLLKPSPVAAGDVPGSNGFAVSGSLAGGPALVANDMHLDLRVPGLWFRAQLVYPNPRRPDENVDVTGAALPGTPVIVAGSNTKIAWGFTNAYADTVDWVRVRKDPADDSRYLTADGSEAIARRDEIIHVRGADDDHLVVEDTRWGPIIAHDADGTPLALAWTAQQPGAFNLALQKLELAETADEAAAIMHTAGIPPQNLVVGDRFGSIAWTIAGRLPKRIGDFDPALPADWSKPGTGWDGWLDPDATPLIANPPWKRIWTANQRITEAPWLGLIGDGGYDLGARAGQIRDDLRAHDAFTPKDMLAIQLDDRAVFLERWKDLMKLELARAPTSPAHDALAKVLGAWNGRASIDSVAYRVVRAWRNEVIASVLDGFAAEVRAKFPEFALPKLPQSEYVAWRLIQERPAHLLPPTYADWDALLIACADRVGESFAAQPGGLDARTWGERNTMRIAHPLSRALPAFVARALDMPADELPGDRDMPRVQSPTFGASERFAVSPGREAEGYFMLAGGQSGHPLSPYYGAGHEDWAHGTPTPFLPGPAQHRIRFEPSP